MSNWIDISIKFKYFNNGNDDDLHYYDGYIEPDINQRELSDYLLKTGETGKKEFIEFLDYLKQQVIDS